MRESGAPPPNRILNYGLVAVCVCVCVLSIKRGKGIVPNSKANRHIHAGIARFETASAGW